MVEESLDLRRARLIADLQAIDREILAQNEQTNNTIITRDNIITWAEEQVEKWRLALPAEMLGEPIKEETVLSILYRVAELLIIWELRGCTKKQLVEQCLEHICSGSGMPVDSMSVNSLLTNYVNAETLAVFDILNMEEFAERFKDV